MTHRQMDRAHQVSSIVMCLDFVDVPEESLSQPDTAGTVGTLVSPLVFEDRFIKKRKGFGEGREEFSK